MRRILWVGIACLACASVARGAEVFGTVSENGKPLAAGAALKLECGDATASATTDQFGSYSLKTAATGECRLTLAWKGSAATTRVTVYEKPSRYDLVVKEEGGKLTIARK